MFSQSNENNLSRNIFFVILIVLALTVLVYALSVTPSKTNLFSTSTNETNRMVNDNLIPAESAKKAPTLKEGKWINSESLTLEGMKGRVVIVDFWTFGCYNCRNTLPTLKKFDETYREKGLTIIGVHSPEFDYEKELKNVQSNVNKLGIKYPVVTDNDFETWNAYGVRAWPSIFILDKQGRIRYMHIGEGRYSEQEQVIITLLDEKE